MKIAVISSNGKSGRAFVEAALDAGHSVRGGVHHSPGMISHPNLEYISCDATNTEDVTKLIEGCAVVVSLIGHVRGSTETVQTDAMHVLIAVMHKLGLKRIISLTGTGVRLPSDNITIIDRLLNIGVGMIDPKRINDGKNHALVLQNSDLDWTILRVLKLTNGSVSSFKLTEFGPTKTFVSRTEVAEALLQIVEGQSYNKSMPIMSKI